MPALSKAALALLAAPSTWAASFADFPACHITQTSKCGIAGMGSKPTLVYPGGATNCADGGAYAFVVYPGDRDKLAIHFGGAGACWEANGAFGKQVVTSMCEKDLQNGLSEFALGAGLMDRASGPLKSYSMVALPDCTGDAWMGDTTLESPDGVTLQQRGYANALAAARWTLENFGRQNLKVLNLFGYSSGAIGVVLWAGQWLGDFRYNRAMVLMDSYASYLPPGIEAPMATRWGACQPGKFGATWQAECAAGTVSVQKTMLENQELFPRVVFVNVQSKEDQTQLNFFNGIAKSWGMVDYMTLTGPQLYAATNQIFLRRMAAGRNFHVFYIDGSTHLFVITPRLGVASIAGENAPAPGCSPKLLEWVTALINGRPVRSQCYGPEGRLPQPDSTAYCVLGERPHQMESMGCGGQPYPSLGLAVGGPPPVAAAGSTPFAIFGLACVATAAAAGAVVYRRLAPAGAAQTKGFSSGSLETGVAE